MKIRIIKTPKWHDDIIRQERQKAEMEAERAKEAFKSLSPEEQVAVMQQAAAQQQAQDAAVEQAAQELMMTQQQPSPEETAMMQQQMPVPQEQVTEQPVEASQPAVMAAEGGKLTNKFKKGGSWKSGDTGTNWLRYSSVGLKNYLQNIINRINEAGNEEEKNKIRREAIDTVAAIQQAYRKAYQPELSPVSENEDVRALQQLFQNNGGNAGFTDIADNINIPQGADTADRVDRGWVDALWGPRTSIRNWGSTEYGDIYKDIADLASQAGLTYAPVAEWTYGNNGNTLYGLSMANTPLSPAKVQVSDIPTDQHPVPTVLADASNGTPAPVEEPVAAVIPQRRVKPILRNGSLRYTGLLGPAAALGMMAAGIGKPDYRGLDRAQAIADRGVRTATYQPIGDYIRYSPLDVWSAENRQNAQNRATQRSLLNQSSPSRDAGLIALASQENLGAGQLFRQSQEYNDALKRQAAEFNRGTNQYNSTAFNNLSQFNTGQINQGNQFRAQMALRNALERMDADASWYNSLYGNVGNMFKSIADLGRENSDYNTMARLATSGAYAGITPEGAVRAGLARYIDAGGGELKKKGKRRKRGLTY